MRNIFIILLGCSFLALCSYSLHQITSMPDAYFSWATQECKKVTYPDGKPGACETLPEKYNAIWIE